MFKLISHAAIFLVGAGAGVYWGVHNPTQAANLSQTESAKIQQAVAQAKQQVWQQVVSDQSAESTSGQPTAPSAARLSKYQQMLQSAQTEFNSATAKLNGQ